MQITLKAADELLDAALEKSESHDERLRELSQVRRLTAISRVDDRFRELNEEFTTIMGKEIRLSRLINELRAVIHARERRAGLDDLAVKCDANQDVVDMIDRILSYAGINVNSEAPGHSVEKARRAEEDLKAIRELFATSATARNTLEYVNLLPHLELLAQHSVAKLLAMRGDFESTIKLQREEYNTALLNKKLTLTDEQVQLCKEFLLL